MSSAPARGESALKPLAGLALLSVILLGGCGLAVAGQEPGQTAPGGGAAPGRDSEGPADTDADAQRAAEATELLTVAERELAAGRAHAALTAFERAGAELGRALLYGNPDRDLWGDATRRIAAGSAEAYLRIGEPYLARIEARRALNVDPRDAPLQTLLGTSCYREGRFTEAEAAFAEALRLDPSFGPAHAGQGLLELSSNHLASARERFARAYRLDGDPKSLWFLARIAFIEGDYGVASKRLSEYLKRAEGLPRARRDELRERARVYERLADGVGSRFASRVTRGQLRFDVAKGDEVPLLPVRVNGRDQVYFIFDTGAQDHVLDAAFARDLGLELSAPAGAVETSLGSAERRLAVVDSLNLEGIVVQNVPVSVADFGPLGLQGRRSYYVAGVLSPALLLRDFLIRVDFYHRTIELERYDAGGRAYAEGRGALRRLAVPFRFDADGTGMIVEGQLGASPGHPLLVDTGASDIYLSGLAGRVLRLDPLEVAIGVGGYRREKLRAHFLRELETTGAGPPAEEGVAYEGILGYPFFRDMRLVFDYYHGLLLIES